MASSLQEPGWSAWPERWATPIPSVLTLLSQKSPPWGVECASVGIHVLIYEMIPAKRDAMDHLAQMYFFLNFNYLLTFKSQDISYKDLDLGKLLKISSSHPIAPPHLPPKACFHQFHHFPEWKML